MIRGARTVAEGAIRFSRSAELARPVLVNGGAGLVGLGSAGELLWVMGFTVAHGKIVTMDILRDPERLRPLDLSVIED
jgi:RNA polymerase sigma-70 factor (ECF subfamily)